MGMEESTIPPHEVQKGVVKVEIVVIDRVVAVAGGIVVLLLRRRRWSSVVREKDVVGHDL
jgi:hypothetical protein